MSDITQPESEGARINSRLAQRIQEELGENVYLCYQCVKCTSGCPLADQFDLTPNQVMRSLQLNDPSVLDSKAIWLCSTNIRRR